MELTLDQALQQGVAAHKEGKVQDAERFYRAILQAQPEHPEANHNLGALAVAVGKPIEAIPLFKLALEANPQIEQFWLSYIDVLSKAERFDEASQALADALQSGISSEKLGVFHEQILKSMLKSNNKIRQGFTLAEGGQGLLERKSHDGKVNGASAIEGPSQDQINLLLGHYQANRYVEAEEIAKLLTQKFPNHPFAWKVLGPTLNQLGRQQESLVAFHKSVELSPQDAAAHNNLGSNLRDLGRLEEAETSLKRAIALKPDLAEAHNNLGSTLRELGRFHDAEAKCRRAIELKPHYANAHYNLGIALKELGRLEEAGACYAEAVALKPDFAEAHNSLGVTLTELGRLDESEANLRQAIALQPDFVKAHSNLGATLKELGRLDEAEASYRKAIVLKPDLAEAHNNLGNLLKKLGRLDEAEASLRRSIALNPSLAQCHNNLGVTLKESGRFSEAQVSFRTAIALKPDLAKARDNLLFALNYSPLVGAAELYREYEAYGEYVSSATTRHFDHALRPIAARRKVRIGYSSPDFRNHACRYFMEPMFRHHNRDEFELFAYSNTRQSDGHTERLADYFDHWIDVTSLSDEAMAERIYSDGIDILVDMAGHTKGNRLLVFAMRPAPIQVGSPIGYGYTTGLKEVDYFIGDENLTPLGSEPYFAEQLWRIPAPYIAYEPPREITPDVSDLPALRKGYVTFGSLTRTVRLNDSVFEVWKEILDRVPNSRLRLDQKPFIADSTREVFWTRLEEVGIPRARVELVRTTPHWNAYHDIDITLDCWPHNAGTTTIESLWMGVPVLSKVDRPSMGCVGASVLRPIGLGDWVVSSETEYVERALQASSDLGELATLRASLRQRLEGSAILDGAGLTRRIELAYKEMLDQSEKLG